MHHHANRHTYGAAAGQHASHDMSQAHSAHGVGIQRRQNAPSPGCVGSVVPNGKHLSNCMPYRDPARRAAWMREYRKRKRAGHSCPPASLSSTPSVVRAPEPSLSPRLTIERSGNELATPKTGVVRKRAPSSFKTALDLHELFLSGSSPPRCARIAITPVTVRPAHIAAIVGGDEIADSTACQLTIV